MLPHRYRVLALWAVALCLTVASLGLSHRQLGEVLDDPASAWSPMRSGETAEQLPNEASKDTRDRFEEDRNLKRGDSNPAEEEHERSTTTKATADRSPAKRVPGGILGAEPFSTIFDAEKGEARKATSVHKKESILEARKRLKQEMEKSPERDPLRNLKFPLNNYTVDWEPVPEYLGVLVDGGRHYFPISWLKRLVDVMAKMKYNLLHLRLTDDQAFNVLLQSRPQLAYPAMYDNPELRVYLPSELRSLVAYAKERGVSIMPEVNVPGHAGAWAAVPDLLVPCPRFYCEKGYGIPLDIHHPELRQLLTDVIREVVDIFDDPPFLHLGGDEVDMAAPCYEEGLMDINEIDFGGFEETLRKVLVDVGYPEERVVRWQTSEEGHARTGGIQHFWFREGEHHGSFFASNRLYCDVNGDAGAYEMVTAVQHDLHHVVEGRLPQAVIVGAFELSPRFWFDRNVLGRMLAASLGSADHRIPSNDAIERIRIAADLYVKQCNLLGLGGDICDTAAKPVVPTKSFNIAKDEMWGRWKQSTCDRLTSSHKGREFRSLRSVAARAYKGADAEFWKTFATKPFQQRIPFAQLNSSVLSGGSDLRDSVPHVGVVLDLASSTIVTPAQLRVFVESVLFPLRCNWLQLRLANDEAFVLNITSLPRLASSFRGSPEATSYHLEDMRALVNYAARYGVEVVPELSLVTNATGWIGAGFVSNCPTAFCENRNLLVDLESNSFTAVIFSVLRHVVEAFNTTGYFHAGANDRATAIECFREAKRLQRSFPDVLSLDGLFAARLDQLETRIVSMLEMLGLDRNNLIRYSDLSNLKSGPILGSILQIQEKDMSKNVALPDSFVLVVDIFDGDAWSIFDRMVSHVRLQPVGIIASVPSLDETVLPIDTIKMRLLAFMLGVSSATSNTAMDKKDFEDLYLSTCQSSLRLSPRKCAFDSTVWTTTYSDDDKERIDNLLCKRRTMETTVYELAPVNAFFNDTNWTSKR